MTVKKLIISLIFVIAICLYTGWSIGYNDGMISTVAVGREFLTYKSALKTTIRAEQTKNQILILRLKGQMNNWRNDD